MQAPEGRKNPVGQTTISTVPDGTRSHPLGNPPMNRWAIFFRPAGLGEVQAVVPQRVPEAPEFLDDVGHANPLI